jgi:hypothetical protein
MSRRRKFLVAAAVVLVAAILVPVLRHYQLKAEVERYRAEVKAKGEPMDLAQVLPPAVPPEQNSADRLLKAIASLQQHPTILNSNSIYGMKMVAPGKAMFCARQPDIREIGQFGYTNTWAEAHAAVEQNQEALALLQSIIGKPIFDFHIPYSNGFVDSAFFTNLHLVDSKKAALFVSSAAMVDLHDENVGAAVTNTRAALALAQALHDQRLVISELVRIAIVAIAQNRTWEILQADNANDGELAVLQSDWERLEFRRSYQNALRMEWVVGDATLAQWRTSNAELEKYFNLGKAAMRSMGADEEEPNLLQRAKTSANMFLWRYWWSYPDELRSLRGSEVLMETAQQAETNSAFANLRRQQKTRLDALGLNESIDKLANPFLLLAEPNLHSMLSESVITLSSVLKKVMAAETMKKMTVTAIALKRFQLKYGQYPEKLSELTPESLASIPLDPVDGQPLRYRRNGDGSFLLYSIGEDGKDDGGDPRPAEDTKSFQWQRGRDWVWPQPATAAEVQKFYAEPAKR